MVAEGEGGEGLSKLRVIRVVTERIRIETDPPVDIFETTLTRGTDQGIYKYAACSLGELYTFLNGVRAGAVLADMRLKEEDVPSEPSLYFDEDTYAVSTGKAKKIYKG